MLFLFCAQLFCMLVNNVIIDFDWYLDGPYCLGCDADRDKDIAVESSDEDDAPRISLQEMLDDLRLTDAEDDQENMEGGGAAGSMATA